LKKLIYAAVICFAASSLFAQDATKLPDTPAGQQMSQWLRLCDAADIPGIAKWAEANLNERGLQRFGAQGFAKNFGGDCAENGGYEFLQVLDAQPDRVEVAVRGRKSNAYLKMLISLDDKGKVRIGEAPTLPPQSALPKDLSDKSIQQAVSAQIDKLAPTGQFSGIVMIARGTQPIATSAAGYADNAKKSPITPQSQFTLGSMGKLFTATAIGQLVDQGKLSFDDVVGKFFPNFANQTVRKKVTVGMLLSHTSGMGDFLGKRTPEMMKNGVQRAAEFLPLFEKDELQFEPGKGWSYSNAGLALAGAIVEKVSGEDYPSYLRKHIFDVAGMKNSDPNNIPHIDPRMVVPYTHPRDPNATAKWTEAPRDIGSPAGGAISTAEDLIRFADALRSGKLISKSTFAQLTTPHGNTPNGDYGYAMEIDTVYGNKVVGHGGGFPGVSTHLYIFTDSPYTVVSLANEDPPAAELAGDYAKALAAAKANASK
jgi:CubicO group peptidase (beta-lactamase class C family)